MKEADDDDYVTDPGADDQEVEENNEADDTVAPKENLNKDKIFGNF